MATETTPPKAAEHATTQARLSRRQPILLGTFGTEAERRALVRLPDGAITELRPGDQLDNARVLAVAVDHIALVRGGTSRKLHIPGSEAGNENAPPLRPRARPVDR